MPVLYFIRHGETDFNVAQRLQGRSETRLNARGRTQGREIAGVLRDLFERDRHQATDYAYVSSPLLRARETMELLRSELSLDPKDYAIDDRLAEISYGEWEGFTLAEIQARDPGVLQRRERDKWDFVPPGGESYREVAERVAAWYATVTRDSVIAAHGGVARALMANFRILPEEEATHADILHGVVYVFDGGKLARYS
ncbi:MAG TPA: histidine phosphatase family protein [Rhizomicrobium sp.]|jgi:probable phosphoglycerate mutase|nr:histidine phosphatase family protein [Rhizomicrobium sp.]